MNETFFVTNPVLKRRIYIPEVYCSSCQSSTFTWTRAQGYYTGQIFWTQYGQLTIIMPYALDNFPYDTQKMEMTFYVWGLPNYMATISPGEPAIIVDGNNYIENV